MMRIKFDTANAAFDEDCGGGLEWQSIEILKDIIERLEHGYKEGNCFDVNGNKVGEWKLRQVTGMKTYSVQLRNDCNLMNDNYVGTLEDCIEWCKKHGYEDFVKSKELGAQIAEIEVDDEGQFTYCYDVIRYWEDLQMKQTFRVVFSTDEYVTVDTENCKTDDEIVDLILDKMKAIPLEVFYIDDEKGEPFYE